MNLSDKEKVFLLKLSRITITNFSDNQDVFIEEPENSTALKSKSGAFVTLTLNNRLRGCIGYIFSDKPLIETIKDASIQAAYHDPRFNPITQKEISKIRIEISVLSEPFKMNNYDEIEVGKHGLIVSENGHRGLLLPQVPIEHKMNKEEYLTALCQKAGLPSNYWKDKILNIEMFTATIFSEDDLNL